MHNIFSPAPGVFRGLVLGAAIAMSPLVSHAALVDFSDFSDAERKAINGATATLTTDGITATALKYFGGTKYSSNSPWVTLWIRNNEGDHGLGVCTEGLAACGGSQRDPLVKGRGDWNELGNNGRDEVIRLERADRQVWSEFWVSSLDTNSGRGHERGRIYWSNDAKADLNSLSWIGFSQDDLISSEHQDEEGSIFNYLAGHGFDRTAKFVFFRADVGNGTDNDYLVYKAGTAAVPAPPALLLMGSALTALGFVRRRKS